MEWLPIITLTSGVMTLVAPTSEWLPYSVNAAFGIAQLCIGAFALYMTLRFGLKRFQGEVAIMRGYFFLRMSPRVDYNYFRLKAVGTLGEKTLLVRGTWWQAYDIRLGSAEERNWLHQRIRALGAREMSSSEIASGSDSSLT